jgi:hypothetical protein
MDNHHRTDLALARSFLVRCEVALDLAGDEVATIEHKLALCKAPKLAQKLKDELARAKGEARAKACIVDVAKAKCRELARIVKENE